jgi:hypothetical protein
MDTVQLKTHAHGRKQSTVAFVRALVNAEAMTAQMTAERARCCWPVPSGYAAALSSLAMNSRRRHLDRSPWTGEPYHNDSMRCGRLAAQPKSSSIITIDAAGKKPGLDAWRSRMRFRKTRRAATTLR